jgi:ribonucrease Y
MELVIAALVLAAGIVAAAVLLVRRSASPDGARSVAPDGGELYEREAELARSVERAQSLERSLDRRSSELDRREAELEARAAELDARSAKLDGERQALHRLHEEHTRALERVAGMSAGQAKQALLK